MRYLPLRWIVVLAGLIAPIITARAHFCGPPEIKLTVGETLSWRITADLVEKETVYTPKLTGSNGVAQVYPLTGFSSRHGDFLLTGLAPGTNILSVHWLYLGNGFSSDCAVSIVVVADPRPLSYPTVPREGSLVTYDDQLPADTFRSMIDRFIPAESQKLLVLTECFAGNIAKSPSFQNAPNTCILSATVQNQTGKYGGYHDDAARALKQEAGRSARTVHEQGVKGKKTSPPPPHGETNQFAFLFMNSEWPITGGTLAPEGFSLEPITANSAVKSRHIVVFMGDPQVKNVRIEMHGDVTVPLPFGAVVTIRDAADRDAIKQNFSGQPNTTFMTAGGEPNPNDARQGLNGWDMPGTSRALARAIQAVGDAIRNSPNPAREQFILFVGDHGGTGFVSAPFRTNAAAQSSIFLPEALTVFGSEDALYELISRDPNGTPQLHVQIEPNNNRTPALASAFAPPVTFAPGSFSLTLSGGPGNELTLADFTQFNLDWDGDGLISPAGGEYFTLRFPITEFQLFSRFLGGSPALRFENRSDQNVTVTRFRLEYGSAPRTAYPIPPPRIRKLSLKSGQVQLTVVALQFENYVVEVSTDLKTWLPLSTNQPITEVSTITAAIPQRVGAASYRLRWLETP